MSDDTDIDRQNAARIAQLGTLDKLAQNFGRSLSTALTRSTASGRGLDSVLGTIGATLARVAARAAAGPLRAGVKGLLGALTKSDDAAESDTEDEGEAFAKGGVFRGGRVTPFAAGGVVAAPTYFPMANGTGLMGEAGPEAIMPLRRGPDGRLGVAAGAPARPVSVHVTIATPDPSAFRRSEAQVAATLARAVARGQRAL
ncbi:phage tail tape measure protein [Methylobacterium sp. J-076]|uniref:phage tail tape measure protein n=1 Tax=Methylobacterium sp. J-076 TaxID=2836655 RepID=UPI001FB9F2BE|nr:phage tail tape measure protein [Methylobacterium sp. J-076]MCJ2011223.1 phage tail tape measure protein [Methylobacterium sp. J-076]